MLVPVACRQMNGRTEEMFPEMFVLETRLKVLCTSINSFVVISLLLSTCMKILDSISEFPNNHSLNICVNLCRTCLQVCANFS
jgi:hypothetical protein